MLQLNWSRGLGSSSVALCVVNVWISHPFGPSRSFELSSTSCECIRCFLCVVVEVVVLDMVDGHAPLTRSLSAALLSACHAERFPKVLPSGGRTSTKRSTNLLESIKRYWSFWQTTTTFCNRSLVLQQPNGNENNNPNRQHCVLGVPITVFC